MLTSTGLSLEASLELPTKITLQTVKEGLPAASTSSNMIYYSFDPQFATLVFSIYSRNEHLGFSIFHDAFSLTAIAPPTSILSYAHTVGLQLVALGEHYASVLSQVRAGSVIFLVGVGSLVCWKIWDYWNSGEYSRGGGGATPSPSREAVVKAKRHPKTAKFFLSSFMEDEFVDDIDEFGEDPTLIQHLMQIGCLYLKSIILGKYFGPESPVERKHLKLALPQNEAIFEVVSPLSSERNEKSRPSSSRQLTLGSRLSKFSDYEDAGSLTSDIDDDSLPYDRLSVSYSRKTRKLKKRHQRSNVRRTPFRENSNLDKEMLYDQMQERIYYPVSRRYHPYDYEERRVCYDLSSSETSPRMVHSLRSERSKILWENQLASFQRRCQGDGSETPDWDKCNARKSTPVLTSSSTVPKSANYNSNDDWFSDSRLQPDGEEQATSADQRSISTDVPLSDILERMKQKTSRRSSVSRNNSVSSRVSNCFMRDDSICSNLSDLATSECSELSLELSVIDDSFAEQTIISFAGIEEELNTLKSSMQEMDDEYVRYASRPNPYLLKTTFSDDSIDSDDLNPRSLFKPSCKSSQHQRSQSLFEIGSTNRSMNSSDLANRNLDSHEAPNQNLNEISVSSRPIRSRRNSSIKHKRSRRIQGSLNNSVDTSSLPSDLRLWKTASLSRRGSSTENSLKLSQDDAMLSLEWDNSGCLKPYEDDAKIDEINQSELDRLKFLPDHSSLELDLEKELQSPTSRFLSKDFFKSSLHTPITPFINPSSFSPFDYSPVRGNTTFPLTVQCHSKPPNRSVLPPSSLVIGPRFEFESQHMSASIDSAVYSAPGSRSGSSTPRQALSQSMMSSGFGSSIAEPINTEQAKEEVESTSLERKSWTPEESYVKVDEEVEETESPIRKQSPPPSTISEGYTRTSSIEANGETTEEPTDFVLSDVATDDGPLSPLQPEEDSPSIDELNGNVLIITDDTMGNTGTHTNEDDVTLVHLSTCISTCFAVGEKQDLISYSNQEWQGDTVKAETIRRGYEAIPQELGMASMHRIRGDNYCGIRASLFLILCSGHPVPRGHEVLEILLSEVNEGSQWVKEYSFGRRLNYSGDEVEEGFRECLETLDKMILDLSEYENKSHILMSLLNNDSTLDLLLCEAVKMHMLAAALTIHAAIACGHQVPLFGTILFSRQSCPNPKEFLLEHLNVVGDTAGLEQVEMFLLGYALQVTLRVVRLSSFGKEDFISYYPDEYVGQWPLVTLIAEDDRHYNALVN